MAGGEGLTLIHLAVCLVTCVVAGVNTIPAVDEGGALGDRLRRMGSLIIMKR